MLNHILCIKYLNIDDLLKINSILDLTKEKYTREILIERLFQENLIKTSDLIFKKYIKDDLKKLQIIKKYERLNIIDDNILYHFIYKNNLECIKYLTENNVKGDVWSLKISIINNYYDIFIYLLKSGYTIDNWVIYYILEHNKLLFLKYLYDNHYNINYENNIYYSCKANNMNCLKYLIEKTPENIIWSVECSYIIIKKNNLDFLKYCIENGCQYDIKTFYLCVEYCDLNILKYLVSINCPFNIEACNSAAENNNLEYLQYLQTIGCKWNESTIETACEFGHYKLLKYLIKNGCPFDENASYYASLNGNMNCLLYLIKNGANLNEDIFTNLIQFGNIEYLKIIYDLNCPYNKNTSLSNALFKKNNEIILFLYEKGFRCNEWVNKTNINYLEKLLIKNGIKIKKE